MQAPHGYTAGIASMPNNFLLRCSRLIRILKRTRRIHYHRILPINAGARIDPRGIDSVFVAMNLSHLRQEAHLRSPWKIHKNNVEIVGFFMKVALTKTLPRNLAEWPFAGNSERSDDYIVRLQPSLSPAGSICIIRIDFS